jgi:hypothetical protein
VNLSLLDEPFIDPLLLSEVEVYPVMDCADSVDSQSQQVLEDDDTGSSGSPACEKKMHKDKIIKLKDEKLCLECEWQDCHYHTCNLDQFVLHVSLHIPQIGGTLNKDEKGTGFVVLPRTLLASNSTWWCNLPWLLSLLKYFKNI